MRIDRLTLSNFQCFGPEPTVVDLDDMTAFVGTNGSGKSAILQALCRLFGTVSSDRQLSRSDFHIQRGETEEEQDELALFIEAKVTFPELDEDDADTGSIAECFNRMVVDEEGAAPFCRVRLDGRWRRSNLPEGEIEQSLSWVCTSESEPGDEDKRKMRPFERSRIHVHYIPAARDPIKQVRHVSGTIMHRLLNAVNWSDEVRSSMEGASDNISEAFDGEPGVRLIQDAMGANWQAFHASADYKEVSIRPMGRRLEDILRQIETVFRPSPDGKENGVNRLSDGLKSLFYLSMVAAAFDIEEALIAGEPSHAAEYGTIAEAISYEQLDPPSLTLFAVEEPENHLAPHYLGRILAAFRNIAQSPRAQVVITSHAPSVIRRIEPEEIRHLRLDPETGTAVLRAVKLPDATDEAHKFVRQAVKAYPELYFSRFVVLGEGDSEEVVLPRLSDALGLPFGTSFVSVVPLGGRHVNHFWRLLNDLEIPFCTLLDLDQERGGGGWGRVKYACKQLLAIGAAKEAILTVDDGEGGTHVLSDDELEEMHTWDVTSTKQMNGWARELEKHGVFFSIPLDLDFLMLKRFQEAYEATAADYRGPRIPAEGDDEKHEKEAAALAAVLKSTDSDGAMATYARYDASLFYWYRYLFLGREKPTTHIMALASLSDEDVAADCPAVLRRLIGYVSGSLGRHEEDDDAAA